MTITKPVKRARELQVLSHDHHHGLRLCLKIRNGFNKEIATDRISRYVTYFFKEHLLDHFREEETYVFRYLEPSDELRRKAESQHRRLRRLQKRLNEDPTRRIVTLGEIEEELEAHIRFEERKLFPYLESRLQEKELAEIGQSLLEAHRPFQDQWKDVFWQKQH